MYVWHRISDLVAVMVVYLQRICYRLKVVHLISPLFVGYSFLDVEVMDLVSGALHHQQWRLNLLRRDYEFTLL